MPRSARLDARPPRLSLAARPQRLKHRLWRTSGGQASGIFDHSMIRGLERGTIFRNSKYREDFCGLLRMGIHLNHAHVLIRTGPVALVTEMRRLVKRRVKAKSPLCCCAARAVGISLRDLAGRLEMRAPGVVIPVETAEVMAHRHGYKLNQMTFLLF